MAGNIESPAARTHVRRSGRAQDASAPAATAMDTSGDSSNTTSPVPAASRTSGANGIITTALSDSPRAGDRSREIRRGINAAVAAACFISSCTRPIPSRSLDAIASFRIAPTASSTVAPRGRPRARAISAGSRGRSAESGRAGPM